MNMRQIEALQLVVQYGSVSLAARHLGVTQPAVSRMLRALEDDLGIALFDHRRGALLLREELKALLPDIERAYLAVTEMQRRAQALQSPGAGTVVVGCSAALSVSVVGPACARAMRRSPNANISVRVRNGSGLVDEVASGSIELAITQLDVVRSGLRAVELGMARLMCLLPQGHQLLGAPCVAADDLARYPIVTYAPGTRNGARTWSFLRAHGIRPDAVMVDQAAVACMMAMQLNRIAIVESVLDVEALYRELFAKPLVPRISYPIYAVWPDRPQPPIVAALIADIGQLITELSVRRGLASASRSGEDAGAAVEDVVRNIA